MNRGYIKLYRSSADNPIYFIDKFDKWHAWCDLLILANHQDKTISVRGIMVEVKRGQVLAGEVFLSNRWKWSRGKVKRYLEYLSKTVQQIEQQKSNVTTLVTILNYEKYQEGVLKTVQQTDIPKKKKSYIINKDTLNNNINKENKKDIINKAEKIYFIYPRHVAKTNAIKAITKVLATHNYDDLADKVKTYAESVENEDMQFIPHPATWFNAGQYMDNEAHRAGVEPELDLDAELEKRRAN